jgi:hypothetical protein
MELVSSLRVCVAILEELGTVTAASLLFPFRHSLSLRFCANQIMRLKNKPCINQSICRDTCCVRGVCSVNEKYSRTNVGVMYKTCLSRLTGSSSASCIILFIIYFLFDDAFIYSDHIARNVRKNVTPFDRCDKRKFQKTS